MLEGWKRIFVVVVNVVAMGALVGGILSLLGADPALCSLSGLLVGAPLGALVGVTATLNAA